MKSVQVENYEVREPKIGDIPNFFTMIQEGGTQITEQLIRACVYQDGQPIGDRIAEMPIRLAMQITNEVIRLSGMGGEQGNA
jgi:hypothetical protein